MTSSEGFDREVDTTLAMTKVEQRRWKTIKSNAKDFTKYPDIADLVDNMNGLHSLRVRYAYAAAQEYLTNNALLNVGMITKPNLLGTKLSRQVAEELTHFPVEAAKQSFNLCRDQAGAIKDAQKVIARHILALFRGHEADAAKKFHENSFVQHLMNYPNDNDEQKILHNDIFFPAIKWWYFPNAVTQGAVNYCPYSAKLTPSLLAWHQRQAEAVVNDRVEDWRGRGHKEGSFRISTDELLKLGLHESGVIVPANTLLIVNVFGLHRRGDVQEATERYSIHGSIRINNPLSLGL